MQMPDSGAEDVFVSYSRQDNEKVQALTGKLREAGVGLWMDVLAIVHSLLISASTQTESSGPPNSILTSFGKNYTVPVVPKVQLH